MDEKEIVNGGSVTNWIRDLKNGNRSGLESIWNRYYSDLTRFARRLFGDNSRSAFDEEDIASSAFTFLMSDKIQDINNRVELIKVLIIITRNKYRTESRKTNSQKRGGGRISIMTDLDVPLRDHVENLRSEIAEPDIIARVKDEYNYLKQLLESDEQRRICDLRVNGATISEIANELGMSDRSISRKIHLIQKLWIDGIKRQELE